eukprot:scaffold312119_cov18-Tisochrysis_lutea.AAC.1
MSCFIPQNNVLFVPQTVAMFVPRLAGGAARAGGVPEPVVCTQPHVLGPGLRQFTAIRLHWRGCERLRRCVLEILDPHADLRSQQSGGSGVHPQHVWGAPPACRELEEEVRVGQPPKCAKRGSDQGMSAMFGMQRNGL